MKRHPLFHWLLVLVLLVSQQIGLSHAMSHGGNDSVRLGNGGRQLDNKAKPVNALEPLKASNATAGNIANPVAKAKLLLDQSCQDCLFLAQLGAALHGKLPVSKQAAVDSVRVILPGFNWHATRSPSPFLSRAPPLV